MTHRRPRKEYWDRLYQTTEYVYGTEPNRYLLEQASLLHPGMKALAVGDGEGRNGVWLAEQGLMVVSAERSPWAIEKGKRLASLRNVELRFQYGDLLHWNWPRYEFDLVVALFFHLGKLERRKTHRSFVDCLKPGGLLILEAFRRSRLTPSTGEACQDDALFTAPLLRRDFHDLEFLELLEGIVALNEGRMHQGSAGVVRLLARKPLQQES